MASNEDKPTWYLLRNGKRYGPFTYEQLERRSRRLEVRPDDQFWQEDTQGWKPASAIPGLLKMSEEPTGHFNTLKLEPSRFERVTENISEPDLGPGGRLAHQYMKVFCRVKWWGVEEEDWEDPGEVELYIIETRLEEPQWSQEWRGRMSSPGNISCYVSSEMFRHFWSASETEGTLGIEVYLEPDRVVDREGFWVSQINLTEHTSQDGVGVHPVVAEIQKIRSEWGSAITIGYGPSPLQ